MGAIFSAFATFIVRAFVIKFVLFTALLAVTAGFCQYLVIKLQNAIQPDQIFEGFGQLSSWAWFFMDFAALDVCLPMILSALILRFSIRRIPVIG